MSPRMTPINANVYGSKKQNAEFFYIKKRSERRNQSESAKRREKIFDGRVFLQELTEAAAKQRIGGSPIFDFRFDASFQIPDS
jgi:hypothetical protein